MIPTDTKVFFAKNPADFRRSFDGLAALVKATLDRDPSAGGLFVFINKRGDQVRVLFRDPHGWCLLSKRLDRGHFRRPPIKEGLFVWQTEAKYLLQFLNDIELTRRVRSKVGSTSAKHLHIVPPS